MGKDVEYKIKLVTDQPSETDLFGGHQKVANAISSTIINNTGGRSIALEGGWGSGKSSIVEMLKNSLGESKSSQNYNLFCFDSWIHEKDPLRRSFLEELIDYFIEKKWVNKSEWIKEKEIISKKRKTTEASTLPKISIQGKILSFLTLMIPIGLSTFSAAWKDGEIVNCWGFYSGIVLSLSPFIGGIILGIVNLIKHKSFSFEIFLNEKEEKVLTESFETPDPTSIEFESVFNRLINDGLKDNNHLIIVIDNLDRIEPDTALSIWATMRVFFDTRNEEAKRKIWLVVPFDRNHLRKMWPETLGSESLDSFIEKTFQVSFRVSPPILSSWKDYLISSLEKCFPSYPSKEDFHIIYRLFHRQKSEKGGVITPRFILTFVNKLGAVNQQWRQYIPLPVQALFCLKSDSILDKDGKFDHDKLLKNTDSISDGYLQILSIERDELANYFTSLFFNLEKERASQVLLAPPIESAINQCSIDGFNSLHSLEGFWDVLETIAENDVNEWFASSAINVTNLAILLSEISEKDKQKHNLNKTKIWDRVKQWPNDGIEWGEYNETIAKGIHYILENDEERTNKEAIVTSLVNSINNAKLFQVKDKVDEEKIHRWFHTTLAILRTLKIDFQDLIKHFKFQGTTNEFMVGLDTISNENLNFNEEISLLVHPGDNDSFMKELVEELNRQDLKYNIGNSVDLLLETDHKLNLKPIFDFIGQKLTSTHNTPHIEVAKSFSLLYSLVNLHDEKTQVSINHLYYYFNYILTSPQYKESVDSAKAFLFFVRQVDNIPGIGNVANSGNFAFQNGINLLKAILATPASHSGMLSHIPGLVSSKELTSNFLEQLISKNYKELFNHFFHISFKDVTLIKQVPVELFLDHYKFFEATISDFDEEKGEELDSPLDYVIRYLFESSELSAKAIEVEFSIDRYDLYSRLLRIDKGNSDLLHYLKTNLNKIDKETWIEAFKNENTLFELLDTVNDTGFKLSLGTVYMNAVSDFLHEILKGDEHDFSYLELSEWHQVFVALDENHDATLLSNIRDKMSESDITDGTFTVFNLLYPLFKKHGTMGNKKIDELFRKVSALIADEDYVEKSLDLLNSLAEISQIKTFCEANHIKSMAKSVKEYLKNEELTKEELLEKYPKLDQYI